MSETTKKIHALIRKTLGVEKDEMQPNAFFDHDLNVGEAEMKELIHRLEDEFDIEIDNHTFSTVKELVDFVKDQLDEIEE